MIGRNIGYAATAVLVFAVGCEEAKPSVATAAPALAQAAAPPKVAASAPGAAAKGVDGPLTLVADRSLVCMVNNQFMGRAQIPVEVEGRTYYGCCDMCKTRLANDAGARASVDPVSNRPVDKAVAVIGMAENGTAVYFENEKNFTEYSQRFRTQ